MIPKSAIREYLEQPRDDHRWIKRLGARELDAALNALTPRPKYNASLRPHQKACLYLGIAHPHFAFYLDMGTGKTLITLELIRYWIRTGLIRRALVFVISDKAFPTWTNQIARFNIDVPYIVLDGSSAKKWDALAAFGDGIIIVTYPGAVAMTVQRTEGKWKLDKRLVAQLRRGVGALVMDESTRAGHDSLTSDLCRRLRRSMASCYALAGRPFGRDPEMLWAQQRIVDGGESLGETVGLFRAAFYSEQDNPWDRRRTKFKAKDYTFKKTMRNKLMRMVRHRSITYGAEECIGLPKLVSQVEVVHLPGEAEAYYNKIVEGIINAQGNLAQMKNAFVRMRQLSSGFLGFRREEDGTRTEVEFDENPKLDRLIELLENIPDDRKAVIFYEFTFSGRKIAQVLKKRRPIWLWSGTKDSAAELDRFATDPGTSVAVINNRVGAYSLDGLQHVANYVFFYESPVPVIDREQAERRVRRDGQTHTVFQYDLVVKGTLDQRILEYHKEGDDLLAALRDSPAKFLR